MKKILYFAAVLSAFMTSCNSENEIIDSKPTKVTSTITATFDQPATRVQMGTSDGTNTPLQWNAGDQLAVYNKTSDSYGLYQTASSVNNGDASAVFNFIGGSEIVSDEPHLAAYPYARIAATTFEFRYRTTQTYTANSFDPSAMPMVASNASGTEFSFKAQAAVLRLKVSTTASDVTVSSIDITSASNALTGYAAPNMTLGTYGVPTENTSNTVTLNCATPVAINGTAKEFNIVVPGQTYPSGDLTITVKTNKGDFAKTSKAAATFAAGKVYNLNISGVPVDVAQWTLNTSYRDWLYNYSTNKNNMTSLYIRTGQSAPDGGDETVIYLNSEGTLWSRYDAGTTTAYIETSKSVIEATNLSETFRSFMRLTSISGLDNIDVSNVSDFSSCFRAAKFTSLDLSQWQIQNGAYTNQMFNNMAGLEELRINNTFPAGAGMFALAGQYDYMGGPCKVYGASADLKSADDTTDRDASRMVWAD